MKIQWKGDSPWFLTTIYGSPHFSRRQQLWSDLRCISSSTNGAWAMMGDFNSTLMMHEKEEG